MTLNPLAFVDPSLTRLFIGAATLGGGILLAQTVAQLFGLGDGDDAGSAGDFDGDGGDGQQGLGWFSVRALSAFGLLFGLVGWGGVRAGWPSILCIGVAVLAGVSTMALVAGIARLQVRLNSSGTAQPSEAVGREARVYLRIPARGEGMGKVSVLLGGQWLQYPAASDGPEFPTGARVLIQGLEAAGTFRVSAPGEVSAPAKSDSI